jgi:hypothetical protein
MRLAGGILAALALASGSARAQRVQPDDAPGQPQQQPAMQPMPPQYYAPPPGYQLVPVPPPLTEDEIRALESRGRRNRAAGASLIAIGAALDIVCLALIIDYYSYYSSPRLAGDTSHNWEQYFALGGGIAANVMLGVGVPILTSGLRDLRAARAARQPPRPTVSWHTNALAVNF